MTTATTPIAACLARRAPPAKSTQLQGLQVFMENKLAVFGVCLILILMAFSFIGPIFYVTDQIHTDLSNSALPPPRSIRSAPTWSVTTNSDAS